MEITNVTLLKGRIGRNLESYKKEMYKLSIDLLFTFSPHIVAYCEVHDYLTGESFNDEETAETLLKFDSPLKILAEEWGYYKQVKKCNITDFVKDFVNISNEGVGA